MTQDHAIQEKTNSDEGAAASTPLSLSPLYYFDILKRRWHSFVIASGLAFAAGYGAVALQQPIYMAEGKILVESQQIPADLVRSTVAAIANERGQTINQRVMTRDNLLAIAEKHHVFPGQQGAEIVSLMRIRTKIKPAEVLLQNRQAQTIAFTVGFEHELPEVSLKVTNEIISMILDEDARARKNIASQTTQFLEREADRLETDLNSIDLQIADIKRRRATEPAPPPPQPGEAQLANLKAELLQKSTVYSAVHPDIKALKQKIAALETTIVQTPVITTSEQQDPATDALERQQASLRRNLEMANLKLAAARLGESLERGSQGERLDVVEQPVLPDKPVRPNKPKLLAVVAGLALAAGLGLMAMVEATDDKIRRATDIFRIVDSHRVVAVPYISTRAETRRRQLTAATAWLILAIVLAAGLAASFSQQPVDQMMSGLLTILK